MYKEHTSTNRPIMYIAPVSDCQLGIYRKRSSSLVDEVLTYYRRYRTGSRSRGKVYTDFGGSLEMISQQTL